MVVHVANEIGVLSDLAKILADHGINILAIEGAGKDSRGTVSLLTDDNLHAGDALTEHRYSPEQRPVIVLDAQHRPGLLQRVATTLAHEGINIQKLYGSALSDQDYCLLVLKSSDDERALVLLNE